MPAPRNKIIIRGTLGEQESWSVNLTYIGPGGAVVESQEGLQTWADNVALSLDATVSGEVQTLLGNGNSVDEVAVLAYGAAEPLIAQAIAPVVGVTGASAATHPTTVACVISLLTGQPGASRRGRFYWPATGAGVSSSGFFAAPTLPADIVPGFAEMLTAIGDATPNAERASLAVYSPTLSIVTPVTAVSCGSVPDTQRRRRDDLIEAYVQEPMPYVP